MRVAHLLRKYNPTEWGGTETAIQRLSEGLRQHRVDSVVYCPRLAHNGRAVDPLAAVGCTVKRFRACVPVWGLPPERRRQMIAVGGNLMSFHLIGSLWREPGISVIHSHALGRLGGIGLTVAQRRRIPFVVTVHGGVYDLPDEMKRSFNAPEAYGWEWGKLFGGLLRSRRVLVDADAIITCNPNEAAMIRLRHPDRRVVVQPHGVQAQVYQCDHRPAAREAFPWLAGRSVLLAVGRIDPIKNQGWLVDRMPELLQRHPRVLLVLAGACTDEEYGQALRRKIAQLGVEQNVILAGRLPPADPRLIGLMQEAQAVILPSLSETFGLILLEAWAAGTAVLASHTSGATALIEHGENGGLFELAKPETFYEAAEQILTNPGWRARSIDAGRRRVIADYDTVVLTGRIKQLYEQLIEEKHAVCDPA
jgi:glycosyltransferase involved in cell wall biosynthesis